MAGNIYHSWAGTVLTITSDSGTSSSDLKGATGDTGIRGPQGPKGEKGNGIDSVNGQIGDVVLTYEDVGALPDTYVPPVTKVNSKTGEVTLTYEDVGALPNTYVAPVTSVNTKTGAVQLTYSDVNAAAANHTHTASDVGALAAGGTAADSSKLGGKSASEYALKTDTAPDSSKLGGKAPEYYVQPRNLLDNSDFRNPVNQRGKTTTDSSFTGYVLDRWSVQNSGTLVTLNSNGLNVAASAGTKYLFQRLNNVENGKTYTFAAALSDGTIGVCAFTLSSTTSTWEWIKEVHVSSSFQIGVAHSDWMPLFVAMSNLTNTSARIIWAALYEGSYTAETLPPYVPKGYAAEFVECRRYYKRFTSPNAAIIGAGHVTGSTKCIYFNAPDNQPMRIVKPSCTFTGLITVRGINGYIAEDYSGGVFTVYANATGCISMIEITRGDAAAWNTTNNTPVVVQMHGDSVFELIADL